MKWERDDGVVSWLRGSKGRLGDVEGSEKEIFRDFFREEREWNGTRSGTRKGVGDAGSRKSWRCRGVGCQGVGWLK